MRGKQGVRLAVARLAVAIGSLVLGTSAVQAQPAPGAKPASTPFTEAVAQAKKTGRPLVVFGMSETCSRCQALKQGLATQEEFKLLMTQYVATEIPFGGREFSAIFKDITNRDSKIPKSIGGPSVFIFTAQGETVYAGPNRESGIAANDEFKKLLISGIEKNGGVRGPVAEGQASLASTLSADLSKARKLLSENQPVAAAAILSKHIQQGAAADEQVAAVIQLTGLSIAKSKGEQQLESLVEELSEKGHALVQAAVAMAGTNNATRGAVQLAELSRVFASFPAFAGTFEAAWKELREKSNLPNLQEQAELIDKARQAESGADPAQAIAAYELVVATYPKTQAAELSERRITQLKETKAAPSRVWKSKDGKFSVTATLVSFDGKAAQLRTSDGKTVAVPLDALSPEDQRFLHGSKSPE
jgi:Thioredoxin-like/SLA1 homology domain 1, SHD1